MAGPGTSFSGPVISGTKKDADGNGPANTGLCLLTQTFSVPYGTPTFTFSLPAGALIANMKGIITTAVTGATVVGAEIGTTSGGSDLGTMTFAALTAGEPGVFVPTVHDVDSTYIGPGQLLYGQLTFTGTATAGVVFLIIEYIQTVQLTAGTE